MSLRMRISAAMTLWFALEAGALVLVVHVVGLAGAMLIGIVTGLVGASLLKATGLAVVTGLRRRGTADLGGAALDATLAGVGAVLLLLPGFVSDAVGLALAWAPTRAALARLAVRRGIVRTGLVEARFVREGATGEGLAREAPLRAAPTIDLPPKDWRPLDERGRAKP